MSRHIETISDLLDGWGADKQFARTCGESLSLSLFVLVFGVYVFVICRPLAFLHVARGRVGAERPQFFVVPLLEVYFVFNIVADFVSIPSISFELRRAHADCLSQCGLE